MSSNRVIAERDWADLIAVTKEVGAIRLIEAAENLILRNNVSLYQKNCALKMLRVCMHQKVRLEKRMADLVNRVVSNPYWNDKIPAELFPENPR